MSFEGSKKCRWENLEVKMERKKLSNYKLSKNKRNTNLVIFYFIVSLVFVCVSVCVCGCVHVGVCAYVYFITACMGDYLHGSWMQRPEDDLSYFLLPLTPFSVSFRQGVNWNPFCSLINHFQEYSCFQCSCPASQLQEFRAKLIFSLRVSWIYTQVSCFQSKDAYLSIILPRILYKFYCSTSHPTPHCFSVFKPTVHQSLLIKQILDFIFSQLIW